MLIVGAEPPDDIEMTKPEFSFESTLHSIQRKGSLRVGITLDLPGFAVQNPTSGRIVGLEADLARIFARHIFACSINQADDHIEFVSTSLSDRVECLQQHHVDIVLANFADTPDRRRSVDFAGHYLSSAHTAVIAESSEVLTDPADLNELRVAVVDGTTDIESLLPVAPHADVLSFATPAECIEAVALGKAEAFWATQVASAGLRSKASRTLIDAPFQRGRETWGVGLPKGEGELGVFIDTVIHDTLEAGTLKASLGRCFGSQL